MSTYRLVLAFVILAVVGLVAEQSATTTDTPEVLALKAEIQVLREDRDARTRDAAQCDLNWASTRAQLASVQLAISASTVKDGRAQLDGLAKAAGLTIDWPDEKNKLVSPVVRKVESPTSKSTP